MSSEYSLVKITHMVCLWKIFLEPNFALEHILKKFIIRYLYKRNRKFFFHRLGPCCKSEIVLQEPTPTENRNLEKLFA